MGKREVGCREGRGGEEQVVGMGRGGEEVSWL